MFGAAIIPSGAAPSVLDNEQPDFVTRSSRGLDWLLAQTGVPGVTESAGRAFGGMFGMPELGAELGKNFPRDVVNLLPAMASPLMGPAAPLGLAASAALSGASGYERSGGNVAAGLVSGALAPLTPVVGRAGGQLALKALGAPAVAESGQFVAGTVNQRLSQYLAENVAATGLGEAGGQVTSVASGQGLYNPLTPENMFSMVAGNIPFAAMDLPQLFSPLARPARNVATPEMLHNMKKEVAATARQHPSDRLRIDEEGNVEVIGLNGKVDKYTNLSEANMALRQVQEGPLALSLPEEGNIPLTDKEKLDKLKTTLDAEEKRRLTEQFGVGTTDQAEAARHFLEPETQAKLASGMSPAEAVARMLNKKSAEVDDELSNEKIFRDALKDIRDQYGITGQIDRAAVAKKLNPEYMALADDVLSRAMVKYGEPEEILASTRRLQHLRDKYEDDPEVAAALDQELEHNDWLREKAEKKGGDVGPEPAYDPELARVLEDKLPEEVPSRKKTERAGQTLMDHTAYLYATLLDFQNRGIPASEAKIKQSYIWSNIVKKGMPTQVVTDDAGNPMQFGMRDEAMSMAEELNKSNPDKFKKFYVETVKAPTKEAPGQYRIRSRTSIFRPLLENVDVKSMTGMGPEEILQQALAGQLGEEPTGRTVPELMERAKTSQISEGFLQTADRMIARQRAIIQQLEPNAFTGGLGARREVAEVQAAGQKLREQARILFEMEQKRDQFGKGELPSIEYVTGKKGKVLRDKEGLPQWKYVPPENVDMIVRTMEEAGVPLDYNPGQRSRDVNSTLERLYGSMQRAFGTDPILARYQNKLDTLFPYAQMKAGPGEDIQEYAYVADQAKAFYTKAKKLGAEASMTVVGSVEDLQGALRTKLGDEQGRARFQEFMEKGGNAEGYYDDQNKMIVLVADNIRPKANELYPDAVKRVIWHESAGHFGLQSILGDQYIATLRRILPNIPRDERQTIAELYTRGDANNPVVAAEYMARLAETNPDLGVVKEFFGNLRSLARTVLGENLFDFTNDDMKILAKRSRDYLFKSSGVFRPGTSSEAFREGGLGPEPNPLESSSMDYSRATPYLSPGTGIGLSTAWDVARIGGERRGLDPSEAANQAYRTMGQIRSGDAVRKFRWDETQKRFIAPAESGRFMILEPAGSPRATMSRMIQAQTLHDGFQRSIRGDFNKISPVLARRDELSAWASRVEQDYRDSVLLGMSKIAGAGDPAPSINPQDFPQAVAAWAANAIVAKGPKGFEEIARFAPKPVAEMVRLLVKENIEDSRSALGVRQAEELGITTGRIVSAEQKQALEGIMDLQPASRAVDEESERVGLLAQKMMMWEPEAFDGLMFSKPPGAPAPVNLKTASELWKPVPEDFPKKPSWFDRTLQLASSLGEKYPEFYPFLKTARGARALAQNSANQALEQFGWKFVNGKRVRTREADHVKELARDPNQRQGLNILALRQNELIDSANPRKLTMTEINNLRATMPPMSDAQFQNVTTVFSQAQAAVAKSRETIIAGRASRLSYTATMMLGKDTNFQNMTGLKQFNTELSRWLNDPTYPIDMAKFQSMLGPNEVADVFTWLTVPLVPNGKAPIDSFRGMKAHYESRDGYLPEVRFGPFKMQYKQTSDGKIATIAAGSEADVKALEKRLVESGEAEPGTVRYHRSADVRASNMELGAKSLERAMDIEDEAMSNMLRVKLGDANFESFVKPFYKPVKAAMQAEVEKTMGDYMKKRGLKAGRESLDILDTVMNYIPAVAYGNAHAYVRQDGAFYLHDTRLDNQPELKGLAKMEIESALRTAAGGEMAMKELSFQYFMGLNLSTMAFELTQSLSTLAPWLTRHGAGFGGAYRELMKAYQIIGKAHMRNRYDDPELAAAVQRASEEGILDKGLWQEYEDPHRDMMDSIRESTATRQVTKNALDWGKMYLQATRNLYGSAAYLNNRVGFVAGYNRAKKLGLKGEDAYEFASRTTSSTMFSGGRANRAVGLHSAEGPIGSTLAATFGALQSYFFGMVGTMGRSIKEAYRETKGEVINPHDRFAARKSMAQLFGTQLAMAGVLGMPGVQAAMAVLEQMFPEAELNKAIQEIPDKIFGDSDFSRWVGDSLLLGAPTATLPIDVSGRLGLSNVLGISNLEGFNPAQLAGPTGSIVSNIYKAAQTLQRGGLSSDNWFLAGQQAAPTWAKNVMKWWKDDGIVRDYSGNVVTELSNTENVLQGLGFRPKVVAQMQKAQQLAKRAEAASQHREQALTRDLAQGMLSGDPQAVVNRLSQRLTAEPSYDVKAAAKRAARKAVDMTMPVELGRGGTLRSAEDIAKIIQGVAPLAPSGAKEMDRLMAQQAYLGQLGIPGLGVPSARELQRAVAVDALRLGNPEMTVDEARLALAEHRARGRVPSISTEQDLGPMF